jgi:hypothetical protein
MVSASPARAVECQVVYHLRMGLSFACSFAQAISLSDLGDSIKGQQKASDRDAKSMKLAKDAAEGAQRKRHLGFA